MRILTLIAVFSLFSLILLPSGTAQACTMLGVSASQAPEIIGKAEFIGLVRVLQIKETGKGVEKRKEVTLEPVQAYLGALKQPVKIIVGPNSCGRSIMPEGTIYEEIVFENEHGYHISSKLEFLPESSWRELRAKAQNSPFMENLNRECRSRGGALITHYRESYVSVSHCHYLTKDVEKNCNNSRECEGLCLAYYSDENDFIKSPVLYLDYDARPNPKLPGRCSPWKDLDGCFVQVKNGQMQKRECRD